jgi:hypothetical protein
MNLIEELRSLLPPGTFGEGLALGLLLALIIGMIGAQLLYFWNRILQFFTPTKPSFTPGPSAASKFGGCVAAVFAMLMLAVLTVSLVFLAVTR